MRRRLERHHVANIIEAHTVSMPMNPSLRSLLNGDAVRVDLDFLVRFANTVREVEVAAPGERITPPSSNERVSARQALIALGKLAAGYRPGGPEWTPEDEAALEIATGGGL